MGGLGGGAGGGEGVTGGSGGVGQLHVSLLRGAADAALPILQEVGFAAGEGLYQAFCTWVQGETGVARPDDLDAARLNDVLSAFFQATGWGTVSVAPLRGAALLAGSAD